MMRTTIAAAVLVATLAVASAASAHVTLQPSEAPAGDFTRLDVRVPNERDNAGTTKVEVEFPPGFVFVSTEPVPGWTAKITKRKLDKPMEVVGEQQSEEVNTITWTGDGKTGIVKPGEFQDFGLSVATPDKPGTKLTFKALQTYAGRRGRALDRAARRGGARAAGGAHSRRGGRGAGCGDEPSPTTDDSDDDDGAPLWLVDRGAGPRRARRCWPGSERC